jgi:Leucine-rich repeat (LRR) protein
MSGTLPPEIGVLKFMTSFISSYNFIQGSIPTSLGLITPLKTFDIESNYMSGELFKPEYAGTEGLKEIVNFKASWNSFTGSIPTEIGLWTNLQNLAIYDNGLTGTIPTTIGNCQALEVLEMGVNQISGPLPSEIFSPTSALVYLYLTNNELTGQIPNNYGQLPSLEHLVLNNNFLNGTLPAIAQGQFPSLSKYVAKLFARFCIALILIKNSSRFC